MFYLGIDGGGTKTTAAIMNDKKKIVYTFEGKSINYYSEGLETARQNMKELLMAIYRRTGIVQFRAVFIGMSALFGKASEKEINDFAEGVIRADIIGMDSDLYIALKAADDDEKSVVGICGTGSMAAAFNKDGEVVTKGGYGYILGDEGSAYAIALEAIQAAVTGAENSTEPTALSDKVLEFFECTTLQELVDRFYNPTIDRKIIASFAKEVTECARNGDTVARKILRHQAQKFAATVKALQRENEEREHIYLYGGVFQHDEIFTYYFKAAFRGHKKGLKIKLLKVPPVHGAAKAAYDLGQTLPPEELIL